MEPTPLRIFLTGATGFVGGTILAALFETHPRIHIKTLIRREKDAKALQSAYPSLTPVVGDLSDLTLLRATAASVDFIIHATREDIPAAHALTDGLSTQHSSDPAMPRLISLTGPRSLIDLSLPVTGVLDPNSRTWSDVDDIKTILSLPSDRIHAEADQSIVAYAIAQGVGAMLVTPGQLLGQGRGQFRKENVIAAYYAAVKERGRAFVVGDGSVAWSWSSIRDLGDAIVFLMDQATSNDDDTRARIGVNEDGYYFVQTGDVSMRQRSEAVSRRLSFGEVESIPAEDAREIHPFGHIMWGCGATFRADRLKSLGWRPKDLDWKALMEEHGGERA